MKKQHILRLIAYTFIFSNFSFSVCAEENTPLSISLGTVRTEAEASAVRFAIDYLEELDLNIENSEISSDGQSGSYLFLTPELSIQSGDQDNFNGLIAKITGNYMLFDVDHDDIGVPTVASGNLVNVIPVSFGFESDEDFSTVSSIVEVGYVPWYLGNHKYKLGINPKVGFFLQGGYKFDVKRDSNQSGGDRDESAESPDSGLFRIKAAGGIDIPLLSLNDRKVSFLPARKTARSINFMADLAGWYDIVNSEIYHKVNTTLRFSLTKDKHFDLKYENGSGAPNFNEGEQFSANLTIQF